MFFALLNFLQSVYVLLNHVLLLSCYCLLFVAVPCCKDLTGWSRTAVLSCQLAFPAEASKKWFHLSLLPAYIELSMSMPLLIHRQKTGDPLLTKKSRLIEVMLKFPWRSRFFCLYIVWISFLLPSWDINFSRRDRSAFSGSPFNCS